MIDRCFGQELSADFLRTERMMMAMATVVVVGAVSVWSVSNEQRK